MATICNGKQQKSHILFWNIWEELTDQSKTSKFYFLWGSTESSPFLQCWCRKNPKYTSNSTKYNLQFFQDGCIRSNYCYNHIFQIGETMAPRWPPLPANELFLQDIKHNILFLVQVFQILPYFSRGVFVCLAARPCSSLSNSKQRYMTIFWW